MSYAINYHQHIRDYCKQYGMGTPSEIAAALPKRKRRKTSVPMVAQALGVMLERGLVKRLSRGVYSMSFARVGKADSLAHGDELLRALIEMLKPHPNTGVHTSDIYAALVDRQPGWTQALVGKKLRRLKAAGVVFKVHMHWVIRLESMRIHIPDFVRKPQTKYARGLAFDTVPAHNILRKDGRLLERVPIVAPAPKTNSQIARQPEFSIPNPGDTFSIFD